MIAVVEAEGYAPISALQPQYNLIDRRSFEGELADVCEEHGIACVPYYGLAMGFLSGKYTRDSVAADMGTPRAKGAMKVYGSDDRAWAALDAAREIASAHGVSVAAVALAWLREQPTVAAPIASASRVEQLEELLPMAELELTAADLQALRAAGA